MPVILYRPAGTDESKLVYEAGMRAFPPRLPEQQIFYPALNFGYAKRIARDWNTKSRSFAGYVTRFGVNDSYAARFERHVGGREHEERWVPAVDIEEFNRNIEGRMDVLDAYFGPRFRGCVPDPGPLKDLDAASQLSALSSANLREVVLENHEAVSLHYPFWEQQNSSESSIPENERKHILSEVRTSWSEAFAEIPLTIS